MVHDLLVETAAGGTVPWAGVVFSRRALGWGQSPRRLNGLRLVDGNGYRGDSPLSGHGFFSRRALEWG
jgi:hypothetical protein